MIMTLENKNKYGKHSLIVKTKQSQVNRIFCIYRISNLYDTFIASTLFQCRQ